MFDSGSARRLEKAPLWSVPRLALDIGLWCGAALVASRADRPWVTALAIVFIGAFPMHDVLFHSHEGAHRRIARTKWVNEALTCLTHAIFGLSGSGYRSFHLTHHRFAHTRRDPEVKLMNWVAKGAPGVAWILMPVAPYAAVNLWPLRKGAPPRLRARVIRDLAVIVCFHGLLAYLLGPRAYLLFLIVPAVTSLSVVVIMRSICEHHATTPGDRYTNTRTMQTPRWVEFLWSNANYHLEHHLYPAMPFHKLPEVRRELQSEFAARGVILDRGYIRTAFRLLFERRHFLPTADHA